MFYMEMRIENEVTLEAIFGEFDSLCHPLGTYFVTRTANDTGKEKETGHMSGRLADTPPATSANLLQRIIRSGCTSRRIEANHARLVGEEVAIAGLSRRSRIAVNRKSCIHPASCNRSIHEVIPALGSGSSSCSGQNIVQIAR